MTLLRKSALFALAGVAGILGYQVPEGRALSLVDVVSNTLMTHPDALSASKQREVMEARVRQAFAGHLPTIDISAGLGRETTNSPTTRRAGEEGMTYARFESGVELNLNLFKGFEVQEDVAKARADLHAADARLDEARNRIALEGSQAYLNLMRQEETLRLATEKLELHQRILEKIRIWEASGEGVRADLRQAESRLALAESEQAAAKGGYETARARFRNVMGQEASGLERPSAFEQHLPDSLDEALERALRNHPELIALDGEIDAARAKARGARSNYWPTLDLELNADSNDNNDAAPGTNQSAEAMLRMTFNIFEGGADRSKVQEMVALASQTQDKRDQAMRKLREEVEKSWSGYRMAKGRIDHLGQYVSLSKEVTDAYREQFRLGQRSLLDLLNSESEVFTARTALAKERYNYLGQVMGLYASMGILPEVILGEAAEFSPPEQAAPPPEIESAPPIAPTRNETPSREREPILAALTDFLGDAAPLSLQREETASLEAAASPDLKETEEERPAGFLALIDELFRTPPEQSEAVSPEERVLKESAPEESGLVMSLKSPPDALPKRLGPVESVEIAEVAPIDPPPAPPPAPPNEKAPFDPDLGEVTKVSPWLSSTGRHSADAGLSLEEQLDREAARIGLTTQSPAPTVEKEHQEESVVAETPAEKPPAMVFTALAPAPSPVAAVVEEPVETVETVETIPDIEPTPAAPRAWVRNKRLNLRQTPGSGGRIVSKLTRGEGLEVLDSRSKWLRVRSSGGAEGWVLSRLTCPEPQGGSFAALPEERNFLRVAAGSRLRLRKAPNTRGAVLERLNRGAPVLVLGKKGSWLHVRGNSGREGWMSARYLCTPPVPAPPQLLEAAAPAPPETMEVVKVTPEPAPMTAAPVVAKGKTVWVPKRRLNLRGAPGPKGRVLTKLRRGDALTVLESGVEWMRVRAPQGEEGWVLSRLTCPEAVTPEIREPAPHQVGVVMNPGLRLRVKPHHQGKILAALERGTNLWITKKKGNWLKAADDVGRVGWTAARFICSPPLTPIASLSVERPDPVPAIAPAAPSAPKPEKVSALAPDPSPQVAVFSFKL